MPFIYGTMALRKESRNKIEVRDVGTIYLLSQTKVLSAWEGRDRPCPRSVHRWVLYEFVKIYGYFLSHSKMNSHMREIYYLMTPWIFVRITTGD